MGESKLLAFIPWLALQEPVAVGNVNFIPFSVSDGDPEHVFDEYQEDVTRILSGYHDMQGKSITQCTLINADSSNSCDPEVNIRMLLNAAHLLAFAGIAQNEYCVNMVEYINSSCFETVFQRFVKGNEYMSLTTRKRDGSKCSMGHKHGEIIFSMPPQCAHLKLQKFDSNLLKSLDYVLQYNTPIARRVMESVWLFDEACSDSYMTSMEREVILFASAFEQLLDCENKYELTQKINSLFEDYSSIRVIDSTRDKNIKFSNEYGDSEKQWFLCRKWVEELYDLRSCHIHGLDTSDRNWGWNTLEHTLMAAFIFPLIVKILLAQESQYTLTDDDKIHLGCIDHLLNAQKWFEPPEPSETTTTWRKTIGYCRLHYRVEEYVRKHKLKNEEATR